MSITGDKAYFRVFYPQLNHQDWKFTHTVNPRQDIGRNFELSDLLYAGEVEANRGEPVQLDFKHLMSCLTVVFKTNDFTEAELSKAVVKVRAYNQVDVNGGGIVGKIHDYDYDRKSQMVEITFAYKGNGVF